MVMMLLEMLQYDKFDHILPRVIGVRLLILHQDLSRRVVRRLPLAVRIDSALLMVEMFWGIGSSRL